MPASPLRLSVVLPTHNRAGDLRHAIAALLRQSAPASSYEVIVVDNNCTDGTRDLLAAVDDPRVRAVHEERQGLSHARNAGIAAAAADCVAFTDDDVEVAPDWVATLVDALDRQADVDGAGGRVLPSWPDARPGWLTRAHWAPLALQDHGDSRRVFDAAMPIGLIGANVAFRRRVFSRVGLFEPAVQRVRDGIGSTEDHEFLLRLYAAGGRMLYLPKLVARARVQPDRCARRYHRRWHFGHGRFHALMRDPDVERSSTYVLGVPGHLLRGALHDAAHWSLSFFRRDRDERFAAELRLLFVAGFVRQRVRAVVAEFLTPARNPRHSPATNSPDELRYADDPLARGVR
jgi:glucosyl-dolichyl phosphate glucuronosyltransferase